MHFDVHGLFALGRWGEDDAVDEGADLFEDGVGRGARLHGGEVAAQVGDDAGVFLGGAGVEGDGGVGLVDGGEAGGEGGLFRLEGGQARFERRAGGAVEDAVDDGFHLAADLAEAALQRQAVAALAAGAGAALLVIGADVFGQQLGIGEVVLQGGEHARLDVVALDGAPIGAVAALAVAGAAEAVAADDGVAGAAAAAFEEAGQHVARPGGDGAALRERAAGLAGGDGREGVGVDDAQLGQFGAQPFRFGIGAADALARRRVLDEALPVPDQLAGIEAVLQDAVEPLARAGDGRSVPAAAARRGHALGVEGGSDFTRGAAVAVGGEDAAHHLGLGRDDTHFAGAARHGRIAIGAAATGGAGADAGAEAAMGLLGEVGEVEFTHQALEADMHGADRAILHGHDADLEEGEFLLQAGEIGLVAAQPVERLADDEIEAAGAGIAHQAGKAVAAEGGGAGAGGILIGRGDGQPLARCPGLAQGDLVGAGALVLAVGGKSSVDRGASDRLHRRHGPCRPAGVRARGPVRAARRAAAAGQVGARPPPLSMIGAPAGPCQPATSTMASANLRPLAVWSSRALPRCSTVSIGSAGWQSASSSRCSSMSVARCSARAAA